MQDDEPEELKSAGSVKAPRSSCHPRRGFSILLTVCRKQLPVVIDGCCCLVIDVRVISNNHLDLVNGFGVNSESNDLVLFVNCNPGHCIDKLCRLNLFLRSRYCECRYLLVLTTNVCS